jgi:hypothetical protein
MLVNIEEIIEKLIVLRDEIYGCGNGRVKVDKFVKDLKRNYGISDTHN